jgi:RNA polymerase sigma-70 factor (ECF subfamily)
LEVSDSELVRGAIDGDDRAFHALVDRHAPALFRAALSLSRNRADAEDLLQETLVAAHRGLKGFRGSSSIRTWLSTILTRKAFKAIKRSRRRGTVLSLDAGDEQRDATAGDASMMRREHVSGIDSRLDVMQVMAQLPPAYREVLVLRELQGLSYQEIADALSLPRGTIESRIFRARAEFRRCFGPIDGE